MEEPKTGLFGRLRSEARVRARVRPTRPRPKEDRRDKRRRQQRGGNGSRAGGGGQQKATQRDGEPRAEVRPKQDKPRVADKGDAVSSEDVSLTEQGDVARQFLEGLLEQIGMSGSVAVREIDEDTVEVAVEGDDLGLLIGPRGNTLSALQEVTRTVVQRQTAGRNGRLLVDVAAYRQKRRVALERFTRQVADEVKASGQRKVLEPMHPADRKVVHDTANDIEGVSTTSEGEEPRRRVVILPD
jgi:spoIIIJ-associated protein